MKCILCNGKTQERIVEHKEFGISLGKYPGRVCIECGETYYNEEIAEKIQEKSKQMGLFGKAKKVKVAEVGTSIAIRIPKELASFLNLKKGQEVLLYPESKHELHMEV